MAKQASQTPTQLKSDATKSSHRVFKDRPSSVYIDGFKKHIKETGSPETYPGLYMETIPKDATFRVLGKFTIDRMKRPERDRAFCPRCAHPNKFLRGELAWFPAMQICAAIGNCCASQDASADADREFRYRQKLTYEEDYLLAGLPLIGKRLETLRGLQKHCEIALEIYRTFRLEAQPVHTTLRQLKTAHSGHLLVTSTIERAEGNSGYEGPAGFRGKGRYQAETRTVDLGLFVGHTAVVKDFNPVKSLETVERWLMSFDMHFSGEEEALDFIVNMNVYQRSAAVAILESADKAYKSLVEKLDDFWSFFASDNLSAIQRYSDHPDSDINVKISHSTKSGRRTVNFVGRNMYCRLAFSEPPIFSELPWPSTDHVKKKR